MRLFVLVLALILTVLPATAAARMVFGATIEKRNFRIVLHFPEGAERAAEADCTSAQVDALRGRLSRLLDFSAHELVATHPGKAAIVLDRAASCGQGGSVVLSRFLPDDPVASELFEPGKGWRIVG